MIKLNRNDLEQKINPRRKSMKMKRFLTVVFSLLLLLAFIGCSDDTNNSSVTNPNPETATPTGSVTGVVRDACSYEPIQGAIVSISGITGTYTTLADGSYVFKNLPATTYVDVTEIDGELEVEGDFPDTEIEGELTIDSGWRGYYTVTITIPATAKIDGVAVSGYAETYYDRLEVKFSSLETSTGIISNNNADVTVVEGINNSEIIDIGKLGSSIYGHAVYAYNYQPVPAGLTVYLINRERSDNDASGNVGNVVKQTLTQADGSFTLTGLENNQEFALYITDNPTDPSLASKPTEEPYYYARYRSFNIVNTRCNLPIPVDMVKLSSTDELCPFILATSPVNYTDVSATTGTTGLNVVLTFSEAIKATAYNTGNALTASPFFPGLYDDINVVYLGNKTGNIAHTFTWSTDMTKLTINIAAESVAPASIYAVEILDNKYLTDASGNPLSPAPDLNGFFECYSSGSSLGRVVSFSTYGAIEAGAIDDLHVIDEDYLDYNDAPALDWTNVIGAKSYNTYCQLIQWPVNTTCDVCDPDNCTTTGGQVHPYMIVMQGDLTGGNLLWHWNDPMSPLSLWMLWANAFGNSNYHGPMGGDFIFVEDFVIKLSYHCFVRGVDADGMEGPASNIVTIEDTVAPHANYNTYWLDYADGNADNIPETTVITGWRVCFTEPMNEKLVEDITNWSLGAAFTTANGIPVPTIADIDYNTVTWCADIVLSGVGGDIATSWTSTNPGKPVPYNILDFVVKASGMIQDVSGNFIVDPIVYLP
jgi:hypothetical protein